LETPALTPAIDSGGNFRQLTSYSNVPIMIALELIARANAGVSNSQTYCVLIVTIVVCVKKL
jgi:hypothetical protein